MGRIWARVRGFFGRGDLRQELDEEIQAHIEMLIDEHLARGLTPRQARVAARREFGNELSARQRAMATWGFSRLESLVGDVRHGLRGIRRGPAFSVAVLTTLALGIGATTAVFSVLYAVLLKPLPFPDADRLVILGESAGEAVGISVTWGNLVRWKAQSRTIESAAGYVRGLDQTLTGQGEPRVVSGWIVEQEFFGLTGWTAAQGRLFSPDDDRQGAAPTVVVTDEFWRGVLGSDPGVVGRSLTLNDQAHEIIGVLPPGLEFLAGGVDYYVPAGLFFSDAEPRTRHGSVRALARLAPGVDATRAAEDLDGIMNRLSLADPGTEDDHRASVRPLETVANAGASRTLWLLMGAVVLVLVLACANVASLLLGRGIVRNRELAIRAALGAGHGRLARQLLTETLTIAALGGVLGIAIAKLALDAMVAGGTGHVPRIAQASLDLPVLGFALGVTIAVGVLAGLAPVLTQRTDVGAVMKEGARGSGVGRSGQRLRSTLVVAEVAITMVLAFSSTLLVRSLIAAQNTDPGFTAERLLALELRLPPSRYADRDARLQFYQTLEDRLDAQPWVASASTVGCPPTRGNCGDWWYSVDGLPQPSEDAVPMARFDAAQAGVFSTLGVTLRAGREFDDADGPDARIAVVNEALTRRWWDDPQSAIGQSIKIGGPYREGPSLQIVGVVADASQSGPDSQAEPQFWQPLTSNPRARATVLIRTTVADATSLPATRQLLAEVDPLLPAWSLRPFDELVAQTLEGRRTSTSLLGVFAVLAMVLAGVGVYGVLQQWVTARRPEIAIRMALGAEQTRILRWAARHAGILVGLGLLVGAFGAWVASRWLATFVVGAPARDPLTFALAAATVAALAALAAGVPLARAISVDAAQELERS